MKPTLILCFIFLFPFCRLTAQAPSQPQKPLGKVELLALFLAGQGHLEKAVAQRGIGFQRTEDYLNGLEAGGAPDTLIEAIRKAPAPAAHVAGATLAPGSSAAAESSGPAAARESQVLRHLFAAAELSLFSNFPEAEKELRSALAIEPNNPLLHVDLSNILPASLGEPGWDAAIAEDREALRLEPDLAMAHFHIGRALLHQHDTKGAIVEYREVVRLDPDNAYACDQLARLLVEEGDADGAMAAYKEAIARKPDEALFHTELAELLEKRGDLDGAIAQAREAIHLAPDNPGGHFILARELRSKGNDVEAAKEMQIGTTLQAKNPPKRLRVGGQRMQAKLIYQPKPRYPEEAKEAGIRGRVRLNVVIGMDGTIQDLSVLSGHPLLAKAALDAVSKWRYRPTLLNGEPVEVATEIDVNFALNGN
jgi:TonB family protein